MTKSSVAILAFRPLRARVAASPVETAILHGSGAWFPGDLILRPSCVVAAMAVSVQDLGILVQTMATLAQAMTAQAQATAAGVPVVGGERFGHGGGGGNSRVIREKGFNEVAKLARGQDQWEDWSYDFRIAISTMSPEMRRTLDVIQDYPQELDLAGVTTLDVERAERINLPMRSAELFQILVLKTEGEAKLLVKSVSGEDGLRAWQLLHRHYHRKTFAKAIRDHREVLYPKPVRELAEVVKNVMEWEEKATRLEASYGQMPKMLKIAALVEMLPSELKDMIMMQPDDHQEYSQLRQKIFSWTANKMPLNSGPVPMDIGAMAFHSNHYGEEEGEYDVGAINGSCFRCGGWGHAARECATPAQVKGKGKGPSEKGKGKGGKGKGKSFTDTDKTKGKGKGYQGTCWKCGKVGHKSAECRQIGSVEEEACEEEEDGGEIAVGTVWHVGAVEVSECAGAVAAIRRDGVEQAIAPPVPHPTWARQAKTRCGCRPSRVPEPDAVDIGKVERMDVDANSGWKVQESKKGRKDKTTKITESFNKPDNEITKLDYSKFGFSKLGFCKLDHPKKDELDEVVVDIGKVDRMNVDVKKKPKERSKPVKITLDSGAGASCWPEKLWRDVPMGPKTKGVRFAAANGTALKYHGNKSVKFIPNDMQNKDGCQMKGGVCEMKFHVTDTTKPLASALAVVKMGNRIVLDMNGSYILNVATGEKVILKEEGGTYVFEVESMTNVCEDFTRQG